MGAWMPARRVPRPRTSPSSAEPSWTDEELERGRTSLLQHLPGLADGAAVQDAVVRGHELLARAPSTLLSATLDDAVGELRRPNMPGTVDRPNWSLPLPVLVEDLPGHPLMQKVAAALADGVRATP